MDWFGVTYVRRHHAHYRTRGDIAASRSRWRIGRWIARGIGLRR
jgi:hypothetical protein